MHNDVFSSLPECSIPAAGAGFEPLLRCMSLLTPSLQERRRSCAHTQSPAKAFPLMRMCQALLKRSKRSTAALHSRRPLQTGTRVNSPPNPRDPTSVSTMVVSCGEGKKKMATCVSASPPVRGRHHEDSTSKPPLASIRWGGRPTSPSLGTGEAWCRRCPCTEQQVQQGTQGQEPQVDAHACCAI